MATFGVLWMCVSVLCENYSIYTHVLVLMWQCIKFMACVTVCEYTSYMEVQ